MRQLNEIATWACSFLNHNDMCLLLFISGWFIAYVLKHVIICKSIMLKCSTYAVKVYPNRLEIGWCSVGPTCALVQGPTSQGLLKCLSIECLLTRFTTYSTFPSQNTTAHSLPSHIIMMLPCKTHRLHALAAINILGIPSGNVDSKPAQWNSVGHCCKHRYRVNKSLHLSRLGQRQL